MDDDDDYWSVMIVKIIMMMTTGDGDNGDVCDDRDKEDHDDF